MTEPARRSSDLPRALQVVDMAVRVLMLVTFVVAIVVLYFQNESAKQAVESNKKTVTEFRLKAEAEAAKTQAVVRAIQRGLQAHDANVLALLRRINSTTTCEKDCPVNRESRAVPVPVPSPVVIRVPAPSPNPAPKPPPCDKKNGKCK